MTPARRIFVLLGAYEDLTDRESRALRRGDIKFVVGLCNRKRRMAQAMKMARKNAVLSEQELAVLQERVRTLEKRETANLDFLREEMARTRAELSTLNTAAKRTRQVRRGYVGPQPANPAKPATILGCA
ncbi:MAG: hypothetical protein ACREIA_09760 [Opitutaceae bacterium]